MKNKLVFFLAFIAFPLIVGLACSTGAVSTNEEQQSTPVEVAALAEPIREIEQPTDQTAEIEPGEELPDEETLPSTPVQGVDLAGDYLLISKQTWGSSEDEVDQIYVGFILQNQSPELTLKDVEYEITLLDSNGQVIGQEWNTYPYLFPEQSLGIFYLTYQMEGTPLVSDVDITFGFGDISAPNEFFNPLNIEKPKYYWEGLQRPFVTGLIKNVDQFTYADFKTNILLFNADGVIVGGGIALNDFVPSQEQMGFATAVDAFDSVVSVEAYPVLTTYSKSYEDSEAFWSRSSILDENFYIGNINQMFGGAIIKNNLKDLVLENAIFSVTFLNEEGYVTNFGTEYIDYLLPGETLGVSPYISSHTLDANPATYTAFIFPGEIVEDYEISQNVFRVNNAVLGGSTKDLVTVNFTNTYSKQASSVDIYVLLYDESGNILGGEKYYSLDPISAGSTFNFELYVSYDTAQTVSRVEAWVLPSYITKFE